MGETSIEWTDKVWNPVTGCTKVSQGCKNCYAERMFHRPYPGRAFTDVRTHPERLDQPLRWRKPCRIFVNSMSDLFHESVPVRFIAEVFNTMVAWRLNCRKQGCDHDAENCYVDPGHTYQILTKRPERMLEILKPGGLLDQDVSEYWPGDSPISLEGEIGNKFQNVWLGVSVEDQKTADERIPLLLQTPAAVRWVSYEPALRAVDFTKIRFGTEYPNGTAEPMRDSCLKEHCFTFADGLYEFEKLDWIVAGGESGPYARPSHPDWFRSVRDQCQAAGVPFFFKQWGEWMPIFHGIQPSENDPKCRIHDGFTFPITVETRGMKVAGQLDIGQHIWKVGKKGSGRLLDGREWNEFPCSGDVPIAVGGETPPLQKTEAR